MAAPTYSTDLTTIIDFDNDTPAVNEPSTWTAGRSPIEDDTDFPIQSSTHGSLTMNTTGKAGIVATGSTFTWTSGDYLFGWIIWLAPGAIAAEASGGLALIAGSSSSVYKVYYVGGNVSGLYPYGGWQNFAVDPEMTADESNGTATSFYVVGAGANVLSAVSKGNPLGIDVFRYGRGELRVVAGDGTTPATFAGMATANDASAARWGLFQAISGSYKFKGKMVLGFGGLTTFVDANKSVVIDDSKYVQSSFNAIEILNASSDVSWTNITVTSLSTVSRGTFTVVDNATVVLDGCTFADMDTFAFLSNSTVSGTVFRRCNAITSGGADLSTSSVLVPTVAADTSGLIWNQATDPGGALDDMTFSKGANAHHAIEFGLSSSTAISLSGISFSGFNATNAQNDSTLHIKRTSGTVTINLAGCTGNISYKSAGATVLLVNSTTLTLTGLYNPSEVRIYDEGTTTAVAGQESVTSGTYSTGIDAATYPNVDIRIGALNRQFVELYNIDVTSDLTLPIQQPIERNYSNPT